MQWTSGPPLCPLQRQTWEIRSAFVCLPGTLCWKTPLCLRGCRWAPVNVQVCKSSHLNAHHCFCAYMWHGLNLLLTMLLVFQVTRMAVTSQRLCLALLLSSAALLYAPLVSCPSMRTRRSSHLHVPPRPHQKFPCLLFHVHRQSGCTRPPAQTRSPVQRESSLLLDSFLSKVCFVQCLLTSLRRCIKTSVTHWSVADI